MGNHKSPTQYPLEMLKNPTGHKPIYKKNVKKYQNLELKGRIFIMKSLTQMGDREFTSIYVLIVLIGEIDLAIND